MATQQIVAGDTSFDAVGAGDTFYVLSGGQTISANLDGSGQNTSVIGEIQRAFTGKIGSSTESWKTAFSSYLLYNAATGELWFESDALDTETTAIIAVTGGGTMYFTGDGIATRFEQSSGVVVASNGTTITTGRFSGGRTEIQDSGSGPTVVLLQCLGGHVHSRRPHTTIDVTAGTLILDADSAGAVNAQGTINVYGGRVILKDTGTITKLNWYAGEVDASQLSRPTTVTAIDINMRMPGAQAFLDNGLFTFSTAPTFTGSTSKRLMSDGRPL